MNKHDFRDIKNGLKIPTECYCDEPVIIKADDGAWLCTIVTGGSFEGVRNHVTITRSNDKGVTWSAPISLEPPDSPDQTCGTFLKVKGRIYCFYGHNTDNHEWLIADPDFFADGKQKRVDSCGYLVYRFSDDNGISWSKDRYTIPIRLTEIDRKNPYGGQVRFGWNVSKAFLHNDAAFVGYHKIGRWGENGWPTAEGVLLKCTNIFESDCNKHQWETLPDGDLGLRSPAGGSGVAEEQYFTVLSEGSFYVVYRTMDGRPVESYSRDGGHTWTEPQYIRYAHGAYVRNPRAANFVWRCENGKYLYWFHNNGCQSYGVGSRNPAWVSGGIEADSPGGKIIHWSQPEILLYDDDPAIGMSYPDLLEDEGKYYITETQKDIARLHEIPPSFFEMLWEQFTVKEICKDSLVSGHRDGDFISPDKFKMPKLRPFLSRDADIPSRPSVDRNAGFSLDIWINFHSFEEGKKIFDSRNSDGAGILIKTSENGAVEVSFSDAASTSSWTSDANTFSTGLHHLGVIVDGSAKIIMLLSDGILNDGRGKRPFGHGRYSPLLRDVNGDEEARLGCDSIEIKNLRVYNRALKVTEMIGNYRYGIEQELNSTM